MFVASLILSLTVVTILIYLGVEARNYTRTYGALNKFAKRTKRLVVFPKEAFILSTLSMTKNLLDGRPAATVMIYELDHIVSLPDSLHAWKPTRKPMKLSSSAPTPPMALFHSYEEHDIIHNSKPKFQIDKPWPSYSYQQIWAGKPFSNETVMEKSHAWRESYIASSPWYSSRNYIHPPRKPIPLYKEWMGLTGHKQRREIFGSIEKAAKRMGLDIKACILRTICEVKRFLLPPGKSLIQDIIRILFSFPTYPHLKDEYSKAAQHKEGECKEVYNRKCPISVLELVLRNQIDLSKL